MAGKFQRKQAWYITWIEGGRHRQRSLGRVTEAEAEAARRAQENQLATVAAAGPCFQDWAVTYATWHSQEYPDSYYRVEQILRCHLIPAFGPLPLLAIDRAAAEGYKRARAAAGASPGTLQKEWRTLQASLNAAVAHDVIPHNPIAAVRGPRDLRSRPPHWYRREELQRLYQTELQIPKCTTHEDAEMHRRFRWTWQLLANTGLRRGEALHLRWSEVDTERIAIHSNPEARTKSGKWRAVPVSRGAAEALDALKRPGAAHVLPQLNPVSITRAFSRTLKRAGLAGSLHSLRHTYCAHLVQQGTPLRHVQVLAGHASVTTTERYAHLAPDALRAIVQGLDL